MYNFLDKQAAFFVTYVKNKKLILGDNQRSRLIEVLPTVTYTLH